MPTQFKTPRVRTGSPITSRPSTDSQKYPMLKQTAAGRIRTFEFKYPPSNVQFDSLAPEWVEVNRPGLVPMVGLSQYRLMRVQFEFLISNPFDGIWYPIDDELLLLRQMASSTDPIFFLYMDKLLSVPVSLPGANRTRAGGMFFRIVDMNISSLRRNTNNEITAAQCSITMQEDFNIAIKAVEMPAIEYPPILKPRVPSSKKDQNPCGIAPNSEPCRRTISSQLGTTNFDALIAGLAQIGGLGI